MQSSQSKIRKIIPSDKSAHSNSHGIALLQNELSRRCTKNPNYSLRSFARSLGLSHTVLSLVLSGKRSLSKAAAAKISENLGLNPEESSELFITSKDRTAHKAKYTKIDLETFELLSDWIHYAILSLVEIPGCLLEAKWVAKRLGIGETAADLAIRRLVKLDMLAQQNGKWAQTQKPIKVENKVSTSVTRGFHQNLLTKAGESLENDTFEIRDFSSITFAMNPDQIPFAREKIRIFRRELCKELEGFGKPTEVYNLTVQIFPVTKKV